MESEFLQPNQPHSSHSSEAQVSTAADGYCQNECPLLRSELQVLVLLRCEDHVRGVRRNVSGVTALLQSMVGSKQQRYAGITLAFRPRSLSYKMPRNWDFRSTAPQMPSAVMSFVPTDAHTKGSHSCMA